MRNELSQRYSDPTDGAISYGNGVIGPLTADRQDFNSLRESPIQAFIKQAEILSTQENLVTVSQGSRLGEFINHFIPKLPRWVLIPAAGIISLAAVSCGDSGNATKDSGNPTPQASGALVGTETPSQAASTPPKWYLTQGPHYDGLSNGERYAIDIGPQHPNDCPGPPVKNSPFPSPAAGEVIHAGGDSPQDYYHSIVEIQTKSGEILGSMHLANIRLRKGDIVRVGDPLGDVSCDVPPGGKTDSSHVHQYLKDIEENPVPIKGVIFTDGVVGELPDNYKGYLDKDGVQKLSNSTHFDSGPNKNVLGNYLQLVSTGNGSFRMELRFADGKPVYNQSAYIYSVKKDIDGNAKPDREIKKISSGELGVLRATLPPGEYMLLFDKHDKVKGIRFTESEQRVGISNIDVKKDQITTKQTTLGRIIANMKVDPKRPIKGFFSDHDAPAADVCIDGQDNGKVYTIDCIHLSDLNQDGIDGKSRAVFNLIPDGSYLLSYAWYDATNGWQDYTAKVDNTQGQTQVASNQTTEFNCLTFAPKVSNPIQAAECTIRQIK